MHTYDNKPSYNIFDEIELIVEETNPITGKIVGIKPDPLDSTLWYYKIEFHKNGTWVHQDRIRKERKRENDNPPPPAEKEKPWV